MILTMPVPSGACSVTSWPEKKYAPCTLHSVNLKPGTEKRSTNLRLHRYPQSPKIFWLCGQLPHNLRSGRLGGPLSDVPMFMQCFCDFISGQLGICSGNAFAFHCGRWGTYFFLHLFLFFAFSGLAAPSAWPIPSRLILLGQSAS